MTELPEVFSIRDSQYRIDAFGVIHQVPPFTKLSYDQEYVRSRYDTIPALVREMSFLRAGLILGICGRPETLLDVGYGNGEFIRTMTLSGSKCFGTDISGYPVPHGCKFITWEHAKHKPWNVVTFFDSLEHFEDLETLSEIKSDFIVVTAPWFPFQYLYGGEKETHLLEDWKHLRPGEHLHHFHPDCLSLFMKGIGYLEIASGSIEDMIRKREGSIPNTFTSIFRKAK